MAHVGRLRRFVSAGLAAVLVAGVGALASPAAAATDTSLTFVGHGWGHGRGMGQYGALGYAVDHGWSYAQILDHFYGGTVKGVVASSEMTVDLLGLDDKPLVVVGPSILLNGGAIGGTSARFTPHADGTVTVERGTNCAGPWTVVGTSRTGDTRVTTPNGKNPNAPVADLVRVCEADKERAYRGELSVVWHAGGPWTINHVPTESYLRGVVPRESPAYWGDLGGGKGMQALRAQAVAARSYALAGGARASGAKTCDTTACQVYGGAGIRWPSGAWEAGMEDGRTDAAISATAGEVRFTAGTTTVVRTEFSSSTGGYTVGGAFPAVIDEGDDIASNPNHTWQTTLTTSTIASRLGVPGPVRDVRVTGRNGLGDWGGRVTQVTVVDANGTSRTYTGAAFRTAMGTSTFKSDWFTISGVTPAQGQAVVRALYQDVLGRAPDAGGLDFWTSYVVTTGSSVGLSQGIVMSRERLVTFVTQIYDAALHRKPEPGGLEYWINYLLAGNGVAALQVAVFSSPEALGTLGGGSVETWVSAMYAAVLGRSASDADVAYWTQVATQAGRPTAVMGIAYSREASLRRLEGYYQQFLGRSVDASGLNSWLPLMSDRGDFTLPVILGSSPEYWAKALVRYP